MGNNFNSLIHDLASPFSAEEIQLVAIQSNIAATIASKRVARGMNQKEFAAFMGVSQGMVSRWESGETNFNLKTIVEIASKLDISLQSPFCTKRPPCYSQPKIIYFGSYHNGCASASANYENIELKEN